MVSDDQAFVFAHRNSLETTPLPSLLIDSCAPLTMRLFLSGHLLFFG